MVVPKSWLTNYTWAMRTIIFLQLFTMSFLKESFFLPKFGKLVSNTTKQWAHFHVTTTIELQSETIFSNGEKKILLKQQQRNSHNNICKCFMVSPHESAVIIVHFYDYSLHFSVKLSLLLM